MHDNNENNQSMIIEHLVQVIYWRNRFEVSRDLSFLDNAARHEDVLRDYLPARFKDISITKLGHLFLEAISTLRNGGIDE